MHVDIILLCVQVTPSHCLIRWCYTICKLAVNSHSYVASQCGKYT